MHNVVRIATALASIGLVRSAATLRRDEDFGDVIRYFKCGYLYDPSPHTTPWDWGMASHYASVDTQGGADASERAIFPMYTESDDYFLNHKGHVYGADTAGAKAKIWVDFDSVPEDWANGMYSYTSPPNGVYVGKAKYTPLDGGVQRDIVYNCLSDNTFTYQDEKYLKCTSVAKCVQQDGIRYASLADKKSIEVTNGPKNAPGDPLPNAKEIYGKINDQWNKGQGLCDTSPIGIGAGCTVSFDCGVNDPKDVDAMQNLVDRLLFMAEDKETFKAEEEKKCSGFGNRQACTYYQKLQMPTVVQFRATSIPHSKDDTGHERARLKATVTCPPEPTAEEKWCSLVKSLFAIGGSFPGAGAPIGALGGAGAEAVCGGLLW